MSKIKINQGRLINGPLRIGWTVMVISVIAYLMNTLNNQTGFVICLALSFSLFVVWTAFRLLEVDRTTHEIKAARMIMGRPIGKQTRKFDRLEGVAIIKEIKNDTNFSAYLIISENEKVFLISDENEEDLIERLRPILKKLQTELISS